MQAAPIPPAALLRTRLDWKGSQNVMASMLEASAAGGPLPAAKVTEDRVVEQLDAQEYGNKTFSGRSKQSR